MGGYGLSALLAVGFVVSFIVAYAAVAWFMAWVRKRGFAPFAIYRIVFGAAVLLWTFKILRRAIKVQRVRRGVPDRLRAI